MRKLLATFFVLVSTFSSAQAEVRTFELQDLKTGETLPFQIDLNNVPEDFQDDLIRFITVNVSINIGDNSGNNNNNNTGTQGHGNGNGNGNGNNSGNSNGSSSDIDYYDVGAADWQPSK